MAAQRLIDSVLTSSLVPSNSGVLVETCDPLGTCNQDQWMFKGIFFQHLGYFLEDMISLEELNINTKKTLLQKYTDFIHANASSVWDVRGSDCLIGSWWAAPCQSEIRQVSVETHGSGVAAAYCAVLMGNLLQSVEHSERLPD